MALDLTHPAAPLERFGDCLGIERKTWSGEALDEIATPADTMITAGRLSTCQEQVVELVEAYGDALKNQSSWSKIEGLSENLDLRPGLSRTRVASFLTQLETDLDSSEELPRLPLRLVFRLNKRRILEEHVRGLPEGVRPALFLYLEGLRALLSGGLTNLEKWWDESTPQRLVLFVPEWSHCAVGPYLAIVGGEPQAGLDRLLASSPERSHPLPAGRPE